MRIERKCIGAGDVVNQSIIDSELKVMLALDPCHVVEDVGAGNMNDGRVSLRSRITDAGESDPWLSDAPAFENPSRVNPKRALLTMFWLTVQISPTAMPLVLSRFVLLGTCPGNCGGDRTLSSCRSPRTKR